MELPIPSRRWLFEGQHAVQYVIARNDTNITPELLKKMFDLPPEQLGECSANVEKIYMSYKDEISRCLT